MYCKLTQLPTVGEIIDPREDSTITILNTISDWT